jgi:flagellar secretion chaperone FliS
MSINPYQKYKQQSILTSPGPVLIVKLFDRAIRAAKELSLAFEKTDMQSIHNNCCKIQDIVSHLIGTLNRDTPAAKKISDELEPLYWFYYNQCIEMNLKKDSTNLPYILKFLEEWREVWYKIASPNGISL